MIDQILAMQQPNATRSITEETACTNVDGTAIKRGRLKPNNSMPGFWHAHDVGTFQFY
jgi:hypothetical protein